MNIMILMHDFRGGGAERVAVKLANELSLNHNVFVAFTSSDGPFYSFLSSSIKRIDLRSKRVLFSIKNLVQSINNTNPDIVISHLTHVNVSAIFACLFANKLSKLVVVEHSQMTQNYEKQISTMMRLVYLSTKLLYRLPKSIVGVSDGVCDGIHTFTGISREKIVTIYNPVLENGSVTDYSDLPTHPFFTDKNKPIFLFVGRLIQSKRVDLLIEAFSIVKQKIDSNLIIVGDGELRSNLERRVFELGLLSSVSFVGFVSNIDFYLDNCDSLVLCSDWEGLPTVLIEGLAAGIQIISTDCPSGPREILLDGKLGFLCEMGDIKSIALGMQKSILDPIIKQEKYLERFETSTVAQRYLDVLK